MKHQRMQNKAVRATGKVPRNTPIRGMHISLQIPYIYTYIHITKLCRQQAQVIQHHENIGHGEARHRKYKRLKLGGGQAYDRSSD
jgi:hypothetical protein